MNEADTRAELIDPALKAAGWGVIENSRIHREFLITRGRIQADGKSGEQLKADYVLFYRNQPLAVIEAKADDKPLTEGLAQAKTYAKKLNIRFTYATNGKGFYAVDMQTGKESKITGFPSSQALWNATFTEPNDWRDRFALIPFEDRGGYFEVRYYQHIAVESVLNAIANNKNRILLTLATGTGKTFIAFQIAWKLFKSRWNLSRQPNRQPRILFLADRNILADQAYLDFTAFPDDALVRIDPDELRKRNEEKSITRTSPEKLRKRGVPTSRHLFFTIFQTFMTGKNHDGEPAPYFGDYSPDFFDFIVIDECHRGGANDESTWRGILDYFAPAVQLGLTATPKRKDNTDTYLYFGEPVFIYALKDGINDGWIQLRSAILVFMRLSAKKPYEVF